MRRIFVTIIVITAVAACEAPPGLVGVQGIRIAQAGEVTACRPMQTFTTTPGVFGPVGGGQSLEFARNQTLAAARDSGADTVVFLQGGPDDPDAFFVEAQTYNC